MSYRVSNWVGRAGFRALARGVLAAPPLAMTDAPLRVVSMLQHRDVLAYLVAIKSFYPRLPGGRVVIIDDGSLTGDDHAVLRAHIPRLTIRPITDGQVAGLPTGGTWERLVVLGQEARDAYAIQLDADIVCAGPCHAALDAIAQNRPFALADSEGPGAAPVAVIADWAKRNVHVDHVQFAAEQVLADIGLPADARYLRGTSAFVGLPKGSDILPSVHDFSARMAARLGPRWDEWGTEQITSNYAVANAGEATVLSAPLYLNHARGSDITSADLVHFYGTHRFYRARYARLARRVVAKMG